MGNLRARAKREAEQDSEKLQAEADERIEKAKKAHEERAGPVAEWLSTWADMHVSADQLEASQKQTGPPEYSIALDGFRLLLTAVGKPDQGEPLVVSVYQWSPDGDQGRDIERPADLLAAWPSEPEPPVSVPATEYTRELLIELCEAASVAHEHWHDRDSERAQRQVGECLMLLRAGCEWRIEKADDKTVWVGVFNIRGFNAVEIGMEEGAGEDSFYLPTSIRLAQADGDWY